MSKKAKEVDMEQERKVIDVAGVMADINRGNFLIEAGRKYAELLDACSVTRKKGKITIIMDVIPAAVNKRTGRVDQFEVAADVQINKPELNQPPAIFFYTEDGAMTREDPDQLAMELHEEQERETNGRR